MKTLRYLLSVGLSCLALSCGIQEVNKSDRRSESVPAKQSEDMAIAASYLTDEGGYREATLGNEDRILPISAVSASNSHGDQSPLLAVDGDDATTWIAGGYEGHWIQIDLGRPSQVDHLRLVAESSVVNDPLVLQESIHEVYVGLSEASLRSVATVRGEFRSGQVVVALLKQKKVRFIRVLTTANLGWTAWREISVIGRPPVTAPISQATSSFVYQSNKPHFAIDGDESTAWLAPRWGGAGVGISLLLTNPTLIRGVKLTPKQGPKGPTKHCISVDDQRVDLDVCSNGVVTEDGTPLNIEFPVPITGRTIFVETLQSSGWVGWSEIDVIEAPSVLIPDSVTASSVWGTSKANHVADANPATAWIAGKIPSRGAPDWIEMTYVTPVDIRRLELKVMKDLPGIASHEILIKKSPEGAWETARKFSIDELSGSTMNLDFDHTLYSVYGLKIETTSGPSWSAWADITPYGTRSSVYRPQIAWQPGWEPAQVILFDLGVEAPSVARLRLYYPSNPGTVTVYGGTSLASLEELPKLESRSGDVVDLRLLRRNVRYLRVHAAQAPITQQIFVHDYLDVYAFNFGESKANVPFQVDLGNALDLLRVDALPQPRRDSPTDNFISVLTTNAQLQGLLGTFFDGVRVSSERAWQTRYLSSRSTADLRFEGAGVLEVLVSGAVAPLRSQSDCAPSAKAGPRFSGFYKGINFGLEGTNLDPESSAFGNIVWIAQSGLYGRINVDTKVATTVRTAEDAAFAGDTDKMLVKVAAKSGKKVILEVADLFLDGYSPANDFGYGLKDDYEKLWREYAGQIAKNVLDGDILSFYVLDEPYTHQLSQCKTLQKASCLARTPECRDPNSGAACVAEMLGCQDALEKRHCVEGTLRDRLSHTLDAVNWTIKNTCVTESPSGDVVTTIKGRPDDQGVVEDCRGGRTFGELTKIGVIFFGGELESGRFSAAEPFPASFDWIGFDYYLDRDMPIPRMRLYHQAEAAKAPGQRLVILSDGMGLSRAAVGERTAAIREQDVLHAANSYFEMAMNRDAMGFVPFMWNSFVDQGVTTHPGVGEMLPKTKERFAQIMNCFVDRHHD